MREAPARAFDGHETHQAPAGRRSGPDLAVRRRSVLRAVQAAVDGRDELPPAVWAELLEDDSSEREGRVRIEQTGAERQTCSQCGRQFLAFEPGLCSVCTPPGDNRTAAERLLPLKTCGGCGEIYGAELGDCPVCVGGSKVQFPTRGR